MTYPIIRWQGGGGGAVGNNLSVRLGDGFIPLLMPLTVNASSVAASYASSPSAEGPAAAGPTEATMARCRCVLGLAGDMPADLAASALEACGNDPDSFVASLEASGLDVSSCRGGALAPFYQNPWVVGGAAAAVLGVLAYVALK